MMQTFPRNHRSVSWLLALSILLLVLSACQPIVDDRSPVERAFDAGSLMAINGTELFVKIVGEGDPIIMLHGGPGAEHIFFSKYTEVLADEYQLIYYDQRSTGFSIPDTDLAHLTIDTFVEDLEGIRQALKLDKVTLLGWSWGGNLAMLYAMKYPHHLKGIILVNPGNVYPEFDDLFNQQFMKDATPTEVAALDAAYQKLTTAKTGDAYVEFARLFLPHFMADKTKINGLEIIIPDNSAIYGDMVSAALWEDEQKTKPFKGISDIAVPTLIIHGDKDPIPLVSAEKLHETIAGSTLVVFENVGHIPFVEAPDRFYATVREFMQQVTQ